MRVSDAEFLASLSNIINNRVEACQKHGEVKIEAREAPDHVEILVTDNGCGIPPERLRQLMNAGVTFDKADGSGLGLYHARLSIESWGGVLGLDSSPDRGTTVRIRLPRGLS